METANNIRENSYMTNDEISIIPLINLLVRKRKKIIIAILLCFIASGMWSFMHYRKVYVAKSYILLQQPRRISSTQEMYNQYGMQNLVKSTFNLIVRSNLFLKKIALREYVYHVNKKEIKSNLLKYFNISNLDDSSVVDRIKSGISLEYDKQKMDIVTISYTSASPEIAAQVVNNVVNQLNIFYNTQLNDTSKRNLIFLKETRNKTKEELDQMRDKLATFVSKNKQLKEAGGNDSYTNFYDSILAFQELEQAVKLKSQVYEALSKQYEELNVESMENAPSVTVLEQALPPQSPLPRHTTKYCIMGAFLGFLLSAGGIILLNFKEAFNLQESPLKEVQTEFKKDFDRIKGFIRSEENIQMLIGKIKSLLNDLLYNVKTWAAKKNKSQ